MTEFRVGRLAGLELTATPSALTGSLVLFGLLLGAGAWFLALPLGVAALASLLAVLIHWLSELVHHLGHARAAWKTGYPMVGVRLGMWGLFATSLYPPAEPELPAAIHVRRALGGPLVSLSIALLAALAVMALRTNGGVPLFLALFALVDNLFVLGLGAFLPLGFTDGSTLLRYWGKG